MTRHRMPTRPGNDVYHGDRPDYLDKIERGIFCVLVPVGTICVVGMAVGLAWAEVAKWIG